MEGFGETLWRLPQPLGIGARSGPTPQRRSKFGINRFGPGIGRPAGGGRGGTSWHVVLASNRALESRSWPKSAVRQYLTVSHRDAQSGAKCDLTGPRKFAEAPGKFSEIPKFPNAV